MESPQGNQYLISVIWFPPVGIPNAAEGGLPFLQQV